MPKRLITDVDWPDGKAPGWKHTDTGMNGGRFGRIEHAVVCTPNGAPIFDRPIVHEGPHVISPIWGFDEKGEILFGLVKEARDTAAPADGTTSLAFWGPPRGFRDHNETPEQAARREAGEEAGARVALSACYVGDHITNETCTGSWSPVVMLQVDLRRLFELQPDRGEKIYKASFFSLDEVAEMIRAGEHDGALTTSFVLVSALALFQIHVLPRIHAGELMPA